MDGFPSDNLDKGWILSPPSPPGHAMARLRGIYSEVRKGHGAVAFVHGPAFSGKTALLKELLRSVRADGVTVLHASCSIFDRVNTLSVVRQLLYPDFLPGQPYVPSGSGGALHAEVLNKIGCALTSVYRLSTNGAVVLCIDDVHYSDAPSRLFVEQLAASIQDRPVLLVLADRLTNEEPPSAWNEFALTGTHWISLTALSAQAIRTLATDLHGLHVSEAYAKAVQDLSNGNWLFARALLDDHVVNPSGYPIADQCSPTVGRAYRQAVLQSLYGHDPEVREAAEALALTGGTIRTDLLAEITGTDPYFADQAVRELTSCGLLDGRNFRHPAGQETVLSNMSRPRRQSVSKHAAEVFRIAGVPVEEVARWLAAVDTVDTVIVQSATSAEATGIDDVIAQLTVAGPVSAGDPGHLAQPSAGQRSGRKGDMPVLAAQRCANTLHEPQTLWHARSTVAEIDEELGALREGTPRRAKLAATRMLIGCEFPSLIAPGLRGGTIGHPDHSHCARLDAAWSLTGVLLGVMTSPDAAAAAIQALSNLGSTPDSHPAMWAALSALVHAKEFAQASAWCDRILAEPATSQTPGWRAKLTGLQAEIDFRSGDNARAVALAQEALAMVPTAGWGNWVGGPLASLVLAHTAADDAAAAAVVLRKRISASLFDTRYGLRYLYARGHHYLAIGEHLAGLADFLRCGRLMNSWGIDRIGLVHWRLAVAAAYSGMNDYDKAVDHIDETVERLENSMVNDQNEWLRLAAVHPGAERRATLRESIFEALRDSVGTPALISEIERRQDSRPIKADGSPTARYKIYDRHTDFLNKLSTSERRVATLAAKGLTNQKIARELSITVSTVEQHLTKTYKKLGLSGRNELQDKLG